MTERLRKELQEASMALMENPTMHNAYRAQAATQAVVNDPATPRETREHLQRALTAMRAHLPRDPK